MWLLAVSLVLAGRDEPLTSQTLRREPPVQIFATLGLTPEEVFAVDAGRPVAKVLSWGTPSEVYVFGAVHVEAGSDIYMKAVRDIVRLATTAGYLEAGRTPERRHRCLSHSACLRPGRCEGADLSRPI
jgi:hypothetical protein